MSKTLTVTVAVSLSGDGYGAAPLYTQSTTNTAALAPSAVNTANGFVAVTVPALAAGVLVVPPPSSVLVKTYKGVTGDTGIQSSGPGAVMYQWTPGQVTTFGILCTAIEPLELIWL